MAGRIGLEVIYLMLAESRKYPHSYIHLCLSIRPPATQLQVEATTPMEEKRQSRQNVMEEKQEKSRRNGNGGRGEEEGEREEKSILLNKLQ